MFFGWEEGCVLVVEAFAYFWLSLSSVCGTNKMVGHSLAHHHHSIVECGAVHVDGVALVESVEGKRAFAQNSWHA